MDEKEKQVEEVKVTEKVQTEINKLIKEVVDDGISSDNLDYLYRLIDIHKDLANEEYWDVKKEVMSMNYREYGEEYSEGYGARGRARRRDSRGRYMERGRGRGRGNYRGEDMIDEMYENYQEYSEGREEYNRGNYGAHSTTMKSLDYMLQSVVEFIEMLKKDASSQEEMELIKKYTREISEM